jgi:hypothetical protein
MIRVTRIIRVIRVMMVIRAIGPSRADAAKALYFYLEWD